MAAAAAAVAAAAAAEAVGSLIRWGSGFGKRCQDPRRDASGVLSFWARRVTGLRFGWAEAHGLIFGPPYPGSASTRRM